MVKLTRSFLRFFAILGILLLSFGLANSSSREEMHKKTAILIKGGTIYTITRGVIHQGSILIRDGKIQKFGKNLVVPKDAFVLEARDKWIMPGFIVAQSSPIALFSIARGDSHPRIYNYLDPFSLQLRLCLASGITAFSPNISMRRATAKKGYSYINAVVKPIYGRLKEMLIREPAYLYIDMALLKPSEKDELRGFLQRAREFIIKEREYKMNEAKKEAKAPVLPLDLKNYVAILKKELPVRFYADRIKDILKVLAFVDEFDIHAQILGAGEGWLLAEEIGRRNISTIIQPEGFLKLDPYVYPPNGSSIKNALIQKSKGIKFAITSTSSYISIGGRMGNDLLTFPLAAAFAIRGGLEEADALKAITLWPAELMGISHRVGSLEEGKDADIIILDGNPFDYRTYVEYTIINGEILYDKSKSSLYKKIPKPKRMF